MITIPRLLFVTLGAVFSAYHVFLAWSTLTVPAHAGPAIAAMVLYGVATLMSLWPPHRVRMPLWMACFDLAVALSIPLLVTSQLDPGADNGYATWHIAAVGTLMTICAVRRRQAIAWAGVGVLALQTAIWGGVGAVLSLGVVGSVAWVGVAVLIMRALVNAARDARQFATAEREASDWQAAQEAHVLERQVRLRKTYRVAAPMLAEIVRTQGVLSEAQKCECRYLEQAIRDEIRGRGLLTDEIREQVMAARRRGTEVSLLDEGGMDDMAEHDRHVALRVLARAIRESRCDKLIVRSVPRSKRVAVTVVGLTAPDADSADAGEDDVAVWMEIPRHAEA